MNKADFRRAEIYHRYLIIPIQCKDTSLWTASWLDEENVLSMPGGTPIDFRFHTAEEAIAAIKPILDNYSLHSHTSVGSWGTGD